MFGTEDCLGKVDVDQLYDFRDKYFTRDNFFFAITTSLPAWKVKKFVNKYFIPKISNKSKPENHDRHLNLYYNPPSLKIHNDPSAQTYKVNINIAFASKKMEFFDDYTLDFIEWYNRLYVDSFYQNARKQGLIYSGDSIFYSDHDAEKAAGRGS